MTTAKKAKKKPASATKMSLEHIRAEGWTTVGVAEQTIHGKKAGGAPMVFKRDLWGFVDIAAAHPTLGFLFIQATTSSNAAKRVTKILTETPDQARDVLLAGGIIEVWSWSRRKVKRGGTAVKWHLERRPVTLADLQETEQCPTSPRPKTSASSE